MQIVQPSYAPGPVAVGLDTEAGTRRAAGTAAVALAVGWLLTALMTATAIGFQVPEADELLDSVADRRELFIAANGLQITQQLLVVPLVLGLVLAVRAADRLRTIGAGAVLLSTSVLFAGSAAVHGVLGWHVAEDWGDPRVSQAQLLHDATRLHQIADTLFFIAVGGVAVAMFALRAPLRRATRLPTRASDLGTAAGVCHLAQLGFFAVPAAGVLGPIGIVLQIAWFVYVGIALRRDPVPPTTEGTR